MKKIAIFLSMAVVFTFVSCSEDYLDVNKDPNNPTEVTPDLILPTGLVTTANLIFDSSGNSGRSRKTNTLGNILMVNWSQSDGFSWYTTEFQYLVTNTFYDQIWNYSYRVVLPQYELLQDLQDPKYANYKAIGSIMETFHFQILVDAYGDIPYSEALEGSEITTPKLDDAQAVYDSLIVDLSNAITTIDAAANNPDAIVPGGDDILFGGDMLRWKKLANTLKMRILIRQSGMANRQSYIQQQFDIIKNEGSGFLTEDALINPGYSEDAGKQNPFWQSFGTTPAGEIQNNYKATSASEYAINYLSSTNDPRINLIYSPGASGHLGVPQGLQSYPPNGSFLPDNVSNLGPGVLKGATAGAPLMLAAESYFLQAEAALDGYITGNPQVLYENGITASFVYLQVGGLMSPPGDPVAMAGTYYSQSIPNVGWTSSPNKLEAIITQKWVALNSINAFESWIEFNRTGYPSGLPLPLHASKQQRPVRLLYPSLANSVNGGNIPSQTVDDAFTDKIFWAN